MADKIALKKRLPSFIWWLSAFLFVFIVRALFIRTQIKADSFRDFYDILGLSALGDGYRWDLPDSTGSFFSFFLLPLVRLMTLAGAGVGTINAGIQIFVSLIHSAGALAAFFVFKKLFRDRDGLAFACSAAAGLLTFNNDYYSVGSVVSALLWIFILCLCNAAFADKSSGSYIWNSLAAVMCALLFVSDLRTLAYMPVLMTILLLRRFILKKKLINEAVFFCVFAVALTSLMFAVNAAYSYLSAEYAWQYPSYFWYVRSYLAEIKGGFAWLVTRAGVKSSLLMISSNIWLAGAVTFGTIFITAFDVVSEYRKRDRRGTAADFISAVRSFALFAFLAEVSVITIQSSKGGAEFVSGGPFIPASFFGLSSFGELMALSLLLTLADLYYSKERSSARLITTLSGLTVFTIPVLILSVMLKNRDCLAIADWFRGKSPFVFMFSRWADNDTFIYHLIIPMILVVMSVVICYSGRDYRSGMLAVLMIATTQFVFQNYIGLYANKTLDIYDVRNIFIAEPVSSVNCNDYYVNNPTNAMKLQIRVRDKHIHAGYPGEDAASYIAFSDMDRQAVRDANILKGSSCYKITDHEWIYLKGDDKISVFDNAGYVTKGTYFNAKGFVDKVYFDILGRHADINELAAWEEIMSSGMSPWKVVESFIMSEEYAKTEPDNDDVNRVLSRVMLNKEYDTDIVKYQMEGKEIHDIIQALSKRSEYKEIMRSFDY